jgi:rhodanese-related sulfurtransferase
MVHTSQKEAEMLKYSYEKQFMILLLCCVLSIISFPEIADSATENQESGSIKKSSSGPYCGISCLYVAMKLADNNIDFADLIKPEYIGSRAGSSLAELKKAATDNGLYTEAVGDLSSDDLKGIKHPIILHVKLSPEGKIYNHYILFIGDKDNRARIVDPPNSIEMIAYHELAPRWDGVGLIVSTEPIILGKVLAPARKQFTLFASAIIITIVLVKVASIYLSGKVKNISIPAMLTFSVAQSVGLVMVALLIGVIYHFANDEGFLAHAGAVEPVVKSSMGSFIPKVSAKEVEKYHGNVVIIDARQVADYEAGHIDGAINIPTTLCSAGRSSKLTDAKKDSCLVIYCQSAGCPYAETVASNLMEDGFTNIAIYKGGWVDWQNYSGAKNENK